MFVNCLIITISFLFFFSFFFVLFRVCVNVCGVFFLCVCVCVFVYVCVCVVRSSTVVDGELCVCRQCTAEFREEMETRR